MLAECREREVFGFVYWDFLGGNCFVIAKHTDDAMQASWSGSSSSHTRELLRRARPTTRLHKGRCCRGIATLSLFGVIQEVERQNPLHVLFARQLPVRAGVDGRRTDVNPYIRFCDRDEITAAADVKGIIR